ncbi:MAG: polysaccharide biosynthesis C-terminal domain-containing protein, partial [Bacteroidales bacterium]
MGIIQRQAIKGSIYSYLGIGVGFINAVIIAPQILTTEEIGLINILVAYSLPFVQLSTLGFPGVITRMFPYFRNEKSNHHGFLALTLSVTLGGFLLSLLAYFVLKPIFVQDNIEQSPLFVEYMDYLVLLIFFSLLFTILDAYNRVLFDAVLGTFLKDFFFKVTYFITLVLYLFKLITFPQFVFAFVIVQCLPGIIITVILIIRRQFSLRLQPDFISRKMRKMMLNICLFGILAGLSGIAMSTIDKFMINSMIDLSATGVYSVAFYFSVLILIPSKSVRNISVPFVAEFMKKKDFSGIQNIYLKSSINQLILGFLLFIGIWANIHNVFDILPAEYEAGKYVIFFMMLAKLFELATGVANLIIATSKYYRVQTYFMLVLLVLVVISNLIFIPKYGIVGAALASAISSFIYNFLRFIFVYTKFKMQPYNLKTIILLLITIGSYFASFIIPVLSNFV